MSFNSDCTNSIQSGRLYEPKSIEEFDGSFKVACLLSQVQEERDLVQKRKIYNEAYQQLRGMALSQKESFDPQPLFILFDAYALKTCYNQDGLDDENDDEEGFRKSARLMELSLCLQLNYLGLTDFEPQWIHHENIEDLIRSLEYKNVPKGLYFDVVTELNVDSTVLKQRAIDKGIRENLVDTLIHLTYSQQNIGSLTTPRPSSEELLKFHERQQNLTRAIIGDETPEQLQRYAVYLYDRCSFIESLRTNDLDKKVASYELEVWPLLFKTYPENDPDLKSKLAQIDNMQGLLYLWAKNFIKAEPLFRQAFEKRLTLIDAYTSYDKKWDQKYLLCNVRTGLISTLAKKEPLLKEHVEEISTHIKALNEFIDECKDINQKNTYLKTYQNAILTGQVAIAKFQITEKCLKSGMDINAINALLKSKGL